MAYTSKIKQLVDQDRLVVKMGGLHVTGTVAAGSTLTLDPVLHAGKTILLDTAAGSVVTLPASTGSGVKFRFVTSVLATTNSHKIQVANATDVMTGFVTVIDNADATNTVFTTAAGSDTITLNRSTTGSVKKGEWFELTDNVAGFWSVVGCSVGTGGEATVFTAAV